MCCMFIWSQIQAANTLRGPRFISYPDGIPALTLLGPMLTEVLADPLAHQVSVEGAAQLLEGIKRSPPRIGSLKRTGTHSRPAGGSGLRGNGAVPVATTKRCQSESPWPNRAAIRRRWKHWPRTKSISAGTGAGGYSMKN